MDRILSTMIFSSIKHTEKNKKSSHKDRKIISLGIEIVGLLILSFLIVSCQPVSTVIPTSKVTETPKPSATLRNTPIPTATATATQQPDWWLSGEDLKGVKVAVLHPWSGDLAKKMDELVGQFNRDNEWDILVSATGTGSAQQVFQKSETGISIGSGPQVVIAPVEELAYWFKSGSLKTLDEFVNDSIYGMDAAVQSDFFSQFWQQDVVNDQRLGIPASRDIHFLFYNQTWANELGFTAPPATTTQFMTQSCSASASLLNDKTRDNDGTGGWIINRNEYVLISWLRGFGIADFPVDEKVYEFDQKQTIAAFEYLRKMYDDNCSWISRNPTPYEYFAGRQALFISGDLNDLNPQISAMDILQNEDQWLVIPYPSQNGDPVVISQGSSYGIIRSTKAQELASWLFIRWMNEPQQQKALAKENSDLPVSKQLIEEFTKSRDGKWADVATLLKAVQPSPRTSEWRVARFVLPDAFYQSIQTIILPVQFTAIVEMLDETVRSLSNQPASSGW
ncbi:MAG: hypothetical protein CVU46_11420 [Chloroflexi bacterium HGW-Chloroflexi-8]|nr:MAG: hypothetical protein CVU46_11420 [Chloroflexi bacterium HGW-Chloroflexi-8]